MNDFSNMEKLMIIVFLIELVTITILLCSILILRISIPIKKQKEMNLRKSISGLLIECIMGNEKPEHTPAFKALKKYSIQMILQELIAFEHRFRSDEWEHLKSKVCEIYLYSTARQWATNDSWEKRSFAARCFALTASPKDKDLIFTLLEDKVFLVRSFAVTAALKLNDQSALEKIISHMSHHSGYERYIYRDQVLKHESVECFKWIEDLAKRTGNTEIHKNCLSLLEGIYR